METPKTLEQDILELDNQVLLEENIKFKALVKDLSRVFSLASSVVERKNVLPILNNVKLEAKGNTLTISVTDMDLAIYQEIPIQVLQEGATTIPAKILSEIFRKINDEEVTTEYSQTSGQIYIKGQNCKFSLPVMPAKDFPMFSTQEPEFTIQIPSKKLALLLEQTRFSMSNEETRYNLSGIYLHVTDDKLISAASTDGHRLSVASAEGEIFGTSNKKGIILPKKTAAELYKILKDNSCLDCDVQISISASKVSFACSNITLVSKLIDGNFPDYNVFIPNNNQNKLVISPGVLAEIIERVSIITLEKFKAVKFEISDNQINFSAFGEARGSAVETIALQKITPSNDEEHIVTYEGNNLTIGFNPRYLLDVASAVTGKKIEIIFGDSFSPALINDPLGSKSRFVIMPVKV